MQNNSFFIITIISYSWDHLQLHIFFVSTQNDHLIQASYTISIGTWREIDEDSTYLLYQAFSRRHKRF